MMAAVATAADANTVYPHTEDLWATLGHIIGGGSGIPGRDRPAGSPQWVPTHDWRRLAAYRVLAAVMDGRRRYYLPPRMWVRDTVTPDGHVPLTAAEKWREYGDPDVLVDTARSLVLGEDQAWELDTPDTVTAGTADDVHAWLEQWSTDEHVWAKIHAGERSTIGLGDGVYALGWSPAKGRPRLRVYDPGFFFPDLDAPLRAPWVDGGWDGDDFPPLVHVAWDRDAGDGVTVLHRETWRLDPEEWTTPWGTTASWRCWHTVDEWRIDSLRHDDTVHSLPLPGQPSTRLGRTVLVPPTDLGIDFLPLVHVPNDTSYVEHGWGRSFLMRLAQILDDISAADSDLAENASLVGSPTLVMTGAGNPALPAGPGGQMGLPVGASADYLDTSKTLDALLTHRTELIARLLINARLSGSVVGHVAPDQVPSGYALRLGFAPTEALVREMRGVRQDKISLIPKMAARLAIAAGALDLGGDVPPVRAAFGSALPADRAATIEEVVALLAAHAISVRTAVRMLTDAGLPVDDLDDELQRIAEEQASGSAAAAVDAVTALGEAEGLPVARRMLAVDPDTIPPAPPVLTPPTQP